MPSFGFVRDIVYFIGSMAKVNFFLALHSLLNRKNADSYWFYLLQDYFSLSFEKQGKEVLAVPEPGKKYIWLCNHRGFADFFIDRTLTGQQTAYLSRGLVAAVIPFQSLAALAFDNIWFFNRKKPFDRNQFFDYLTFKFATAPYNGLIVYPEGHRQQAPNSLPLKNGCILYAFDHGIPIQICISTNKEFVLNEKTFTSAHGLVVRAQYSEVFYPSNYSDAKAYFEAIEKRWFEVWEDVYRNPNSLVVEKYVPPVVPLYHPLKNRLLTVAQATFFYTFWFFMFRLAISFMF
eukprot:TRINITY_DN5584_c0_g1::TRINITY_DN5584_c0_g1_i1::g.9357::m.9357 TRINITY_DN5584_c0_g1::TRINITY_DN5584_c0_g1_i1::g.9357  ORF type:complete len:290 (-),score=29.64,Acyltransferase/PF01553.16/6.7e-06,Acyltransferase/PF01553.16/2.6e+03,TFR_dimer/PF04253.10/0.087,UPF0197/PF05251.7/0.26 TRINITY_DN5584_c0_g1_i1:200-1069(-)